MVIKVKDRDILAGQGFTDDANYGNVCLFKGKNKTMIPEQQKKYELSDNPDVADAQLELSKRWSRLYRNGEYGSETAVMVLQNPVDYLSGGYVDKLSKGLQDSWKDLLESAMYALTGVSAKHNSVIANDYRKSLSEVQKMAMSDDLTSDQREVVYLVMGLSSKYFSLSISEVPGDIEKYAGQIAKMRAWQAQEQSEYSLSID